MPTLSLALKMRRGKGELSESALLDTGSHRTIFSRELLRLSGFPVEKASEEKGGVIGLGGAERLFYLGPALLALTDEEGADHFFNLERVHFTRIQMVPIVGTDLLSMLNARLLIDFNDETGYIEMG